MGGPSLELDVILSGRLFLIMNLCVTTAFIHLLQVILAAAGTTDPDPNGGLRDLLSKPYESHFHVADLLSDLTDYGHDDVDSSIRPSLRSPLTSPDLKTPSDLAPAAKYSFNIPRQQYYYQNVPSIYRVPTTTTTATTPSTTTSTSEPTSVTMPACTTPTYANHSSMSSCPQNNSSQPNPGDGASQQSGGGVHYTVIHPPVTQVQPYIVVAPNIVMPSAQSEYDEYDYCGYDCGCY